MHLIKSGNKYYLSKIGTKNYLWDDDYIIENGQLKWCHPDIYLNDNNQGDGKSKYWFNTGFIPTNKTTFEVSYVIDDTRKINRAPFMINGPVIGEIDYKNFGFQDQNSGIFNYFDNQYALGHSTNTRVYWYSELTNNGYIVYRNVPELNISNSHTYPLVEDQSCFGYLYLNCWNYGYTSSPNLPYYSLNGKLYSSKFWENGVLIRHFVPVPANMIIGSFIVPSNGMFDIVNQQFYPNQGSGTFTYGKDT